MRNRSVFRLLFLGLTLLTLALAAAAEQSAYLGVMCAPAPRALASQLGLPTGQGLVVVAVQPDSPAATVLKVNDILMRLDDQKLIEVSQLTVLLRGYKDGDAATVTFVRNGAESTERLRLVVRDVPAPSGPVNQVMVGMAGTGGGGSAVGGAVAGVIRSEAGGARVSAVSGFGSGTGATTMKSSSGVDGTRTIFTDANGTIEINVDANGRTLVAKSADGVLVFSGPFSSEVERAAAPPSVRTRAESVERQLAERMAAMNERMTKLRESGGGTRGATILNRVENKAASGGAGASAVGR